MPSVDRARLDMLRVLVVDDNAHMAHILRTVLNGFGIRHVEDARSAVDALEMLKAGAYDFILLDYCLPILDGLEFTRLVRTGRDISHNMIPIIMITGYTERSRVIAARDAGVTEICAKPITPRDLWLRIAEIVNAPRPFIRAKSFAGPDRRRLSASDYAGPERRSAGAEQDGASASQTA